MIPAFFKSKTLRTKTAIRRLKNVDWRITTEGGGKRNYRWQSAVEKLWGICRNSVKRWSLLTIQVKVLAMVYLPHSLQVWNQT